MTQMTWKQMVNLISESGFKRKHCFLMRNGNAKKFAENAFMKRDVAINTVLDLSNSADQKKFVTEVLAAAESNKGKKFKYKTSAKFTLWERGGDKPSDKQRAKERKASVVIIIEAKVDGAPKVVHFEATA